MLTRSLQIAHNLFLVKQVVNKTPPVKKVDPATHHVVVLDCSGSMASDIAKVREQLKSKIPKLLVNPADTLSIIWFSGRGQFGTLVEAESVATLKELSSLNSVIDRWIRCVGLTGFKEPLEELSRLIDRQPKTSVCSLTFMSDGCDNQWGRSEILEVLARSAGRLAAATFVEYGYYADRALLTQMAERCGGQLVFADDFDKYDAAVVRSLQNRPAPEKVVLELASLGDTIENIAWTRADSQLTTYAVDGATIVIPKDTSEVLYLSPRPIGEVEDLAQLSEAGANDERTSTWFCEVYGALSLMSVRMKPKVVLPILRALGDVRFIDAFSGCFGKQRYSNFMEMAREAAFLPTRHFLNGWDPKKVPADDAFTVLELLEILASDEGNRVMLDHPKFKYSKISRSRIDSSENLTAEEFDKLQTLTAKMAIERNATTLAVLSKEIADLTKDKIPALKFVPDPEEAKKGYPIANLTFNEQRPNVSILVRKNGVVDLSSRLPADWPSLAKIPKSFPTFIYRNYAIIKDGLVNVKVLPVKLTPATRAKLEAILGGGPGPQDDADGVTYFVLDALPVVNQKMVDDVDPADFFRRQWELLKAQAAQKVYNSFQKELLPGPKSEGFPHIYGAEATAWLQEQGFTDYSGFGPKMIQAEAKDFYLAKELAAGIVGYSKLPSLNELRKMVEKESPSAPAKLMAGAYLDVESFLRSSIYTSAAAKDKVLKAWLEGQQKDARAKARRLIYEIARTTFALVVGQTWFKGMKLEDTMLNLVVDEGKAITGKVEMREVEVKI